MIYFPVIRSPRLKAHDTAISPQYAVKNAEISVLSRNML